MRFIFPILLNLLVSTLSFQAHAVGGRLLGINNYTEAKDMNGFLNSQGLTDVKRLPGYSIELNTGASGGVPAEFGIRFNSQRLHVGVAGDLRESDFTRVSALSMPLIFRFYLLDRRHIRFDVFGGGGPSWASLSTRKNNVEAQYELAPGDFRLTTLAAGSLQFGFNFLYFALEAGYQWNRIDSITRVWQPAAGAMNNLDLSGPFISLGFVWRIGKPSGGIFNPNEKPARAQQENEPAQLEPPRPRPKSGAKPGSKPNAPARPMPGDDPAVEEPEVK